MTNAEPKSKLPLILIIVLGSFSALVIFGTIIFAVVSVRSRNVKYDALTSQIENTRKQIQKPAKTVKEEKPVEKEVLPEEPAEEEQAVEWSEESMELVKEAWTYWTGEGDFDPAKAKELAQKSADMGNGDAWVLLGDLTFHSASADRYEQAMQCYEKGRELGSARALTAMGRMYLNEDNAEKDYKKAGELMEQAREEGAVDGVLGLAEYLYSPYVDDHDNEKALSLFEEAEQSEDYYVSNQAATQLGWYYESTPTDTGYPDYEKAYGIFQKAADAGFGEAIYAIGSGYEFGVHPDTRSADGPMKPDPETAMQYYEKAAQKGCILAIEKLAQAYDYGNNVVEPDIEKARAYYEQGANLGSTRCMSALGDYYYYVEEAQDYEKALQWYETANDYFALGDMYEWGNGVPADDVKAAEYFQKEIDRTDDERSMYRLGAIYGYTEVESLKDTEKAKELLNRALEKYTEYEDEEMIAEVQDALSGLE